ncbi:hypothetical protein POVWA2_005020 [Plasmodium ovale wallikeri]|uniref:Uncharacterized protein n=1 Tax=Plasmodium ovale wallikeri TaxID=864142 RepID=A0A1A8YJ91_PLAOA|nr:hypothetical protein POVWA2_005020 [Plasmodium ovale wallikeri]
MRLQWCIYGDGGDGGGGGRSGSGSGSGAKKKKKKKKKGNIKNEGALLREGANIGKRQHGKNNNEASIVCQEKVRVA